MTFQFISGTVIFLLTYFITARCT